MTSPIKWPGLFLSLQTNSNEHSTRTQELILCLSVYHTPWLATKDRYPCPSSTSYCSKLSRSERYTYERYLIPLLRIKTVIYSDLVDLSHLTVQLETQSLVHTPHVHVYSGPLVSSTSDQTSCLRRDH